MIRIERVSKNFDSIRALDGLDVVFPSGVTGLVGQNGAGKSTLLRAISSIYRIDEGAIYIDDFPAGSKQGKERVFFLSDNPFCPSGADSDGVYEFYDSLFEIDREKFDRLFALFGLPKKQAVATFSKGMKRQLFIAIALSVKAENLLLDEAFDGLDPLVVDAIKGEIVQEASEGKTIVISSHNILALQHLADRFVILNKGKLAKEGENEEIGQEFVKFQAAFKTPISEQNIADLGYKVVSFRNIGSVSHFVLLSNGDAKTRIEEELKPLFIETVPLEPEEVIALEMLSARKEENHD